MICRSQKYRYPVQAGFLVYGPCPVLAEPRSTMTNQITLPDDRRMSVVGPKPEFQHITSPHRKLTTRQPQHRPATQHARISGFTRSLPCHPQVSARTKQHSPSSPTQSKGSYYPGSCDMKNEEAALADRMAVEDQRKSLIRG